MHLSINLTVCLVFTGPSAENYSTQLGLSMLWGPWNHQGGSLRCGQGSSFWSQRWTQIHHVWKHKSCWLIHISCL